jgi:DNA-binding LacI/PurR family transcriptional regulator
MAGSKESEERAIFSRVVGPGLVDGVIVTATRIGDTLIGRLADAGVPFVVVGRPDDAGRAPSVDADNRGGARAAALHLAGLGYERIGMISPPSNTTAGIDRRTGFADGMAEAGRDLGGRLCEGDWSEESGRLAMQRMLADRPDAVFVGSDRMAVGALRAIRDAGLSCPGDVAVVSFDGILPADQTVPRLTSVVQPVSACGDRAAQILHTIISGEVDTPEAVVFPTELVIRESCGAALRQRVTP